MRNKLTAMGIKRAGDGKLQDGGGLILSKRNDRGSWIYRYSHLGRRREMGLGPWPDLSLADARQSRDQWASVLASGRDPLAVRKAQQDDEVAERDRDDPSLADLVDRVFEARKALLRGDGERGRWRSPLDLHVLPKLGRRRVSSLHQADVHDTIKPIWRTKYPTAQKAVQRLRITLNDGQAMGFPCNPQIVDAAVVMLGQVRHVVQHTPSVPWQDIPDLYARLGETTAAQCNRWLILTAVRIDAGRGVSLAEIAGDLWTVPADRVKGLEGKVEDFRVPLSPQALEIVDTARGFETDLLFPGRRGTSPITDAAVEKCLREMKAGGTPHGFRASFRTWAQDTGVSYDVAEAVLGHKVGGKVERSYARSDLLDQRRGVMDAWARYVTGQEANVVSIHRKKDG